MSAPTQAELVSALKALLAVVEPQHKQEARDVIACALQDAAKKLRVTQAWLEECCK